jgi:catechol 2,3-dioxygenase-like lactoylglutathione lyase family enzyme
VEQRFSLVTLGVDDVDRATAFYERLGWKQSVKDAPGMAFFQCNGVAFGLYPRNELAKDVGIDTATPGFSGVTLAFNTRSRGEVDTVLTEVEAAGAEIVKPAEEAFWGGYSGYFRDPEGHLWEVAWNPGLPLDSAGNVTLPA